MVTFVWFVVFVHDNELGCLKLPTIYGLGGGISFEITISCIRIDNKDTMIHSVLFVLFQLQKLGYIYLFTEDAIGN